MNDLKKIGIKNIFLALAILTIGIVTTSLFTFYYINDLEKTAQHQYEVDCIVIANKINSKLNEHSLILMSGKAFFASSKDVTRTEWEKYNNLYIKNNLMRGVQGLGFAKIIKPNELQSHIEFVRKEGFPEYQIKPIGKRDFYTSIVYLEPFNERNQRAFGFDMYSEPVRRRAMELSRDSNRTTLTSKVKLVQENGVDFQYGTLMYSPVYQNGLPINTVEQRRIAIIGWVYSPFRMNDLIYGILHDLPFVQTKNIHIEIYDNIEVHTSKPNKLNPQNKFYSNILNDSLAHFTHKEKYITKTLKFYNHSWVIVFSKSQSISLALNNEVVFVFLSGILISFLITSLFVTVSRTQTKAEQIADKLTVKLQENYEKLAIINNELNEAKNIAEEHEKKIQDIINTMPDLVWIKDINGVYLDCNIRFEDFFGTNQKNIIGKTDYDFVNKDLADFFRANDINAMAVGKSVINEEVVTFVKDGHQEYLETIKTPIYHKDGSILGILGTGRDITERKQTLELLKISEEKFRNLVDSMEDIVFTLDIEQKHTGVFGKWIENTGLTEDFFIGKTSIDILGEENGKIHFEMNQKALKGEIVSYEWSAPNGDKKLYTNTVISPIKNASNEVIGLVGVGRDITAIKEIDDELKFNKERWEFAVEASNDGLWDWNLENNEVYFSNRWKEMLGFAEHEIENTLAEWSKRVHPEDLDFVYKEIQNHINGNTPLYLTEHRVLTKDENYKWILARGKIVQRTDDGKPLRMVGTHADITERKKHEEEIELKNQELTENNNAKDKLFSIVAHDLKSPFNGFLGLTKMMAENEDIFTHEEKTEMFIAMKKSAENMYSLLENLLEWSRLQRGMISFNPEEVMLRYVVEQNFDILRNTANLKQIKLVVNIPFDFEIIADIPSLNTIFRNLISNAIKFTNIGGEIEVGIIDNEQQNEIQKTIIYVKDSGIGMSEAMINKLIKLDQDVSRRGTEGESSTGLGLLLCSDFVKKHNGKIWVESQENIGTTFYFTLG